MMRVGLKHASQCPGRPSCVQAFDLPSSERRGRGTSHPDYGEDGLPRRGRRWTPSRILPELAAGMERPEGP